MTPGGTKPDGTLPAWTDVRKRSNRWSLLLGNGLSINISKKFDYESLLAQAEESALLNLKERRLFDKFHTRNFEVVLARLDDAMAAAEALGEDPAPYAIAFETIREALGAAVREVHIPWSDPLQGPLGKIKAGLREYRAVYTTSYDLILYWVLGYDGDFYPFGDCFWADGNVFDPENCEVFPGRIPLYYLHGALHLIVRPDGTTRKLVRDLDKNLLDKIGGESPEFPDAWPLLITEGTSDDKMQVIRSNAYLRHVYGKFVDERRPLLIFGHSLGEQDQHLVDAINENPPACVACSMRPRDDDTPAKLRKKQRALVGRLHEIPPSQVYFFDSRTHPLGSPDLCVDP